ncbi:1946_t:CDS:2 [Funneliformis caledonium]|uniref:1946_t:CDS:1 n=1 Tax=Funneliformis caledonium TaxID=1117310 RepID=A0A9N9B7N2_9GLOM|nr:1946_t:CDS:2 [Funneliformis caledonium]
MHFEEGNGYLLQKNYTSWNFFNFGNQLYNVGPDLFLYDFDTYENYYDIDTKVDVGLPIEEIEVFSLTFQKNNKEARSSRSPTTKTLKRTTSQSSLGGTSSSSAVAHTVSPTPSVLSNISALSVIDRLTFYINFSFLCVLNRPNTTTNKRIKLCQRKTTGLLLLAYTRKLAMYVLTSEY